MAQHAISVTSAVSLLHSHNSPRNIYFRRISHLISSHSHSYYTTLSCSHSYSPATQSPYLSPASGSQVLNCSPNRTTNPRKLQYCTASNFPIPGNWNVLPIHWQRCIPLRFTPCGRYSTNRKNVIKCVCGLSKVKVKQSLYRSGQALSVPRGWGSQISGESAHKGGNASPAHLVLISVNGWVDPRVKVRLGGLFQ